MKILLYLAGDDTRTQTWLSQLRQQLPSSEIRVWTAGDNAPADYALVWKPPAELLANRSGLRAIIYLAAGVDYLTDLARLHPGLVPADVPVLRMEDAGMGRQMVEFARYHVLRYFREMHEYDVQDRAGHWQKRLPETQETFTVGVLGLGVLGAEVANGVAQLGFPVRGWSRSPKSVANVQCHAGPSQLAPFLQGLRVVINLLPLTPETENILNSDCFSRLQAPAYVVNIGRGQHLVDQDLLEAIADQRIGGAALDVFRVEPLPGNHPFWAEPRICVTPHIAAVTLNDEGVRQVVGKLLALQAGQPVSGQVDFQRGY
ncbi:MAG: 2-hydroxyacid dehydrogenase [Achromobacter marplatensis]|uniref:2-hydroxyacid dehydrogenase n=1 Tax=Achromobacter marplatensis TaxID=470868 RepID=UPI003D040829